MLITARPSADLWADEIADEWLVVYGVMYVWDIETAELEDEAKFLPYAGPFRMSEMLEPGFEFPPPSRSQDIRP